MKFIPVQSFLCANARTEVKKCDYEVPHRKSLGPLSGLLYMNQLHGRLIYPFLTTILQSFEYSRHVHFSNVRCVLLFI